MLQTWMRGLGCAGAWGAVAIGLAIGLPSPVLAQIVPDETLGNEGSRFMTGRGMARRLN